VRIVECSVEDVNLLASMNRALIDDEKAETDLDFQHLENRMRDFLCSGYKAFLFLDAERVIGYALCNMSKTPVYLRQFFICRNERRKGYGKRFFLALLDQLAIQEIDIDVYSWNDTGIAFWKSLGFQERYINMRYNKVK
jgi:GNAT superfamily N-acetyltransferase